jgi:Zn finger protein HypA/HybF involved in hydrogenase expression
MLSAVQASRAPELEERPTMAKGKTPMAADEGYCVKCKAKRKISNGQQVKMANGRPALKGVCPVCGTGMFKILAPPK